MTIYHWKLASAQTAGRSHIKNNIPCQDYTYAYQKEDLSMIILADGAGYAEFSHLGAMAVVNKMTNILYASFDEYFQDGDEESKKKEMIKILHEEIKEIKGFNGDIKQYACTLLFVALKGDQYIAGHLGDGVIGQEVQNEIKVLSNPENGQYINTTFFVTSENSWEHLRFYKGKTEGKTGFILMSDGTADSLFNRKKQEFAPAVIKMVQWLKNYPSKKIQEALANNLNAVIKEQTYDDCSIAIASFVQKDPEDLLLEDKDYLVDFVGVHSKLKMKNQFIDKKYEEGT